MAVVVLLPLSVHELVASLTPAAGHLPALAASARRLIDVLDTPDTVVDPASPAEAAQWAPGDQGNGTVARLGRWTDRVDRSDAGGAGRGTCGRRWAERRRQEHPRGHAVEVHRTSRRHDRTGGSRRCGRHDRAHRRSGAVGRRLVRAGCPRVRLHRRRQPAPRPPRRERRRPTRRALGRAARRMVVGVAPRAGLDGGRARSGAFRRRTPTTRPRASGPVGFAGGRGRRADGTPRRHHRTGADGRPPSCASRSAP